MKEYFEELNKKIKESFDVASEAKKKGYDPVDYVEILLAKDMAERVEKLISVVAPQITGSGIVERLRELEEEYGVQDWRVALIVSEEIAKQKFCKFKDEREAMEVGIRVGLAYITNGVVASPLEGFVRLGLKERKDGKKYFCLYYSGPIRSAGGTAGSVSVIIADYIRTKMGYKEYDPTKKEVKRISTELYDYHERVTNLQYLPSVEEIEFMVEHLPVQLDGDPSEKYEVSNYKDLPRIETNILRNGVCLIVGEALTLKAPKLWKQLEKWGKDFGLKHWNFLEKFLKLQKKIKAKEKIDDREQELISPDYTFIKDLVAGRPVLAHPLKSGGFRLRYGRCRDSGYSAYAIHPATMIILKNYIAIGTQLRVERPGKATTIESCDSIDGPIVKLKDGSVVLVKTEEQAKKIVKDVEEILYLGDILVAYGEFLNRAHVLVPPGYCEEWWMLESKSEKRDISIDEAIELCKKGIPLHPKYTFFWKEIDKEQLLSLVEWLKQGKIDKKIELSLDYDISLVASKKDPKRVLELLGIPHVVDKNKVIIDEEFTKALMFSLGGVLDIRSDKEDVLEIINEISGVGVRDKSGLFIGARMGRPEKAKMRKMTGSPHILFPVGAEGGRLRCFQSALDKGKIKAQFPIFYCDYCNKETIYGLCEKCGKKTTQLYYCSRCNKVSKKKCEKEGHNALPYKTNSIDIHHYFRSSLDLLNIAHYPELIKGVRGTSNKDHVPERLAKGILRAMQGIYVNKDGTARYDMIETAITHFKPKEIKVSVKKLKELGYVKDIHDKDLENEEQILEIRPQDIILPCSDESLDEKADDFLFNVCNFIDEELVRLYKLKPFYNLDNKKDLIGHLVIGLSPHTSAGIVLRIIGFSNTQGFLAHPYVHAIMRRDCDGDEAGILLLMDALLNFSLKYLPAHRGARQDEPLVLTSKLIPKEVDEMIFDMDIAWKYPLEFYNACLEYKQPWDIRFIEKVGDRLDTEKQYDGFGFTHNTDDINRGAVCSAYKSIPTMQEKVQGQMELAEKIRAVNESDVARLVIERHFIRDIKGNLRKFSMQQFRCVNCNEKYRRPPLLGTCLKCGGRIIFTVAEGSVIKYLEPSISLVEKYELPIYLKQTLELTKARIESVFGRDKEKQEGLGKWFK